MATTKFSEKLIKQITDATKNGNIEWKKRNSIFESNSCRHFTTSLKDVKIDVEINVDLVLKRVSRGHTVIYHKGLTDGRLFVSFEECSDLLLELFSQLVNPTLKVTNDDEVLLDIIDNIPNKISTRDEKIEKILEVDSKSHKSLFSIFKKTK
jgi:hypothetical protein